MTRIAAIIDRISAATAALRTRQSDAERLERHDGEAAELLSRMEDAAGDFEKLARKLEARLS